MSSNRLNLSIIARDGVAYQDEATEVTIPTKDGVITVLPNHIQLVSALKEGEVKVKLDNADEKKFKIRGGVLEVRSHSNVVILADIVE